MTMGRAVTHHAAGTARVRRAWQRTVASSSLPQRLRGLNDRAGDAGMATAEYAIATLAAVGFAGVLVVVLKGSEVKGLLTGIVRQALGA
ncbi:DUF4244 domain-containing protein [Cellulomonas wangsupingiae]|uniref:DUF4244 domain-containing protein n=1 Tax=Cellulomonas wangsupingiae TaxID=2968085 RepID=UPI001D0E9A81|nr:DUF4244 domain-containing protein [Cellulomonas wangsupingiae]MCC2335523.1 DUF4244 domain-containing protein [Cellulomonas wangsupingiae]